MLDTLPGRSTYAIIVVLTLAILLSGVRFGAWGVLRGILAVHIIGEFFSGPFWASVPTYAFLRFVTESDRVRGGVLLLASLAITDGGYRAMRRALAFGGAHLSGSLPAATSAVERGHPDAPGGSAWLSLFAAGIACKAIFLAAAGVLSGSVSVSELKPEDGVGVGAVVAVGDFLVPVALAMRHRRRPKAVLPDLLVLTVLAFLSFSKAALITGVLTYGAVLTLLRGPSAVRRALFNWRLIPLVGLVVLNVGVKSQQRAQVAPGGAESGGLVASAVGGSSARFLGGIQRTYFVVAREVVANGAPVMGGTYHAQVAYLWVPRALWPGKPRVAAEQLYYLLGVTEEAYGTAFAANAFGFLLLDFGPAGLWLGSAALGAVLAVGDRWIPSLRALRGRREFSTNGVGWRAVWITAGIPLSEGGIPMAAIHILLLGGAFSVVCALHHMAHAILAAAGGRQPAPPSADPLAQTVA